MLEELSINILTRKQLLLYVNQREGEEKIGSLIFCCKNQNIDELKKTSAKFVIIGIPEDIGVKANLGCGGTNLSFSVFLKYFLNLQHNDFLPIQNVFLLGSIDFSDLMERSKELIQQNENDLNELRKLTSEIDKMVFPLIQYIVSLGKIPIVIGGGHNNSYGCIKGTSLALQQKLNIINIDPHADFRKMEGRHSGNGFTYAFHEGYMQNYKIIGLHENYNSMQMLHKINSIPNIEYVTFEDLVIRNKFDPSKNKKLQTNITFSTKKNPLPIGIEIDLDAIINMPTSAISPCGFSVVQIRSIIYQIILKNKNIRYIHISEGAPKLGFENNGENIVGKTISYIVSDILKQSKIMLN